MDEWWRSVVTLEIVLDGYSENEPRGVRGLLGFLVPRTCDRGTDGADTDAAGVARFGGVGDLCDGAKRTPAVDGTERFRAGEEASLAPDATCIEKTGATVVRGEAGEDLPSSKSTWGTRALSSTRGGGALPTHIEEGTSGVQVQDGVRDGVRDRCE
mmetsp:Transcript_8783/g.24528  ORF Transcript_8783/g.24528 Transcript_8783/m.24528 type:complete len:156 (-) Transcript_8783:1530-1997(-)